MQPTVVFRLVFSVVKPCSFWADTGISEQHTSILMVGMYTFSPEYHNFNSTEVLLINS
jgi:hypothetical protein